MVMKINFGIFILLLRALAVFCRVQPIIVLGKTKNNKIVSVSTGHDASSTFDFSAQAFCRGGLGILAQEFLPEEEVHFFPAKSYIEAAYIKAVEGSGGLAVPIFINKDYSYYKKLLHSINGVVIPGGYAKIQPGYGYYDAFTTIYRIAKEMNDDFNFFPIFGVCLGFEAFITLSNNHKDPQIKCDVYDEYYPLRFTQNPRNSLMYSRVSEDIYVSLKYLDVTANEHTWCTTLQNFTKARLNDEWKVLTVNFNVRGLKFISSIEHKRYPFLAVQFHPERYYSVWNSTSRAPYSWQAIQANRYFYDIFVELAKLNRNTFPNQFEEQSALINNYIPKRWYNSTPFDQAYVF